MPLLTNTNNTLTNVLRQKNQVNKGEYCCINALE